MDNRTTFELREGDEVYSRDDQSIGTVSDVGWDYLELSTGFLGLQHLYVPASAVDHVDRARRRIYLDLDRDQIPTDAWGQKPESAGAPAESMVVGALVVEEEAVPTMAGTMPNATAEAPAPPVPPAPTSARETTSASPPRSGAARPLSGAPSAMSGQMSGASTSTTPPSNPVAASASTGMSGEHQGVPPSELTFEQLRGRMLYDWDGHAIGHLEGRSPDYFDVQTPIVELGPTLYVPPDAIKYCTRFGCYLRLSLEELRTMNWNQVPAEALEPVPPDELRENAANNAADMTMDMAAAHAQSTPVRIPYIENEDAARQFREREVGS